MNHTFDLLVEIRLSRDILITIKGMMGELKTHSPICCILFFWCWHWTISGKLGNCRGCWCSGSVCHHVTSNHGIEYVWQTCPCPLPAPPQCWETLKSQIWFRVSWNEFSKKHIRFVISRDLMPTALNNNISGTWMDGLYGAWRDFYLGKWYHRFPERITSRYNSWGNDAYNNSHNSRLFDCHLVRGATILVIMVGFNSWNDWSCQSNRIVTWS